MSVSNQPISAAFNTKPRPLRLVVLQLPDTPDCVSDQIAAGLYGVSVQLVSVSNALRDTFRDLAERRPDLVIVSGASPEDAVARIKALTGPTGIPALAVACGEAPDCASLCHIIADGAFGNAEFTSRRSNLGLRLNDLLRGLLVERESIDRMVAA